MGALRPAAAQPFRQELAEYRSYDPEEWSSNRTGGGKWLELRRLPPTDSGVIFYAAAGVGPPRTDIRKSEEKLHLKDSHQTRTGRAQRGP